LWRGGLCYRYLLEEVHMAEMLKVIEVLAESEKGWEDAAAEAVKRATKTLKNIRSIYIENFEAKVEGNKITRYRVNAKISFVLD
jgi:dodecin